MQDVTDAKIQLTLANTLISVYRYNTGTYQNNLNTQKE